MSRRALRVVVAVLVAASTMTAAPAGAATSNRRLPPSDRDALAKIFDPLLEPLGLRTTRATLQRLDTYQPDPKGRHLAIYVEPTGAYSDAEYVANFLAVVRVYLPKVFERWKDLKSFDVCQEPVPGVDDRPEPPPVTQLLANRPAAASIDWKKVTLAGLLAAVREIERRTSSKRQLSVYFAAQLATQPELQAASNEADATSSGGSGAAEYGR